LRESKCQDLYLFQQEQHHAWLRLVKAQSVSVGLVKGPIELDRGKTLGAVATTLGVDPDSVAAWRNGYRTQGLECLNDAPRSGRPIRIDGTQRAKITALACSDAPEGHARWSLRLLAEKVVEAGFCEQISHTAVGNILKKTS
jgi:putative transposase